MVFYNDDYRIHDFKERDQTMNLRNNIFVEVMHAHFNHFLTYYGDDLNNNEAATHGYPEGFFSIFEMVTDPTEEKLKAVNDRLEKLLEEKTDHLPQLENAPRPQVKYNSIMGIRLNLKQIKVGHPDTRVTTVTYRYQFYKLYYVAQFLLSRDKKKRVHVYTTI